MQTSLRTFREDKREGRGNLDPLQFVEGVLATNLAAATGASGKDANQSLTGHTTATLNIIAWDETDNYYLTGQTQEITNRSPNFSAGSVRHRSSTVRRWPSRLHHDGSIAL